MQPSDQRYIEQQYANGYGDGDDDDDDEDDDYDDNDDQRQRLHLTGVASCALLVSSDSILFLNPQSRVHYIFNCSWRMLLRSIVLQLQ